jgi:hypothetical protein
MGIDMLKIIIIIVLIPLILYLFFKYNNFNKQYEKERKVFIEYLNSKGDIDALKAVGEINPFGVYEKWNPSMSKVIKFLELRIEKDKDSFFINFLKTYKEFVKHYSITVFPAFLGIFIEINVIISFF